MTAPEESDVPVQPGIQAMVAAAVARVAWAADEDELTQYAALFTADAVWDFPGNPAIGAAAELRAGTAAIVEGARLRRAAGFQGPATDTRHVVSGTFVDPFPGSTGVPTEVLARSLFRFYTATAAAPVLTSMGTYRDRFVLHGSRWLLAHRRITLR